MFEEEEEQDQEQDQDQEEDQQLKKLNEINERFDAWEERLKEEDEELSKLEKQLDWKESRFNTIEENLKTVEDRQNRFEQLLSLYEEQCGAPSITRFEILDKTKSMSQNLEDHQNKIDDMRRNVRTLKDMIYLISDIHCKYSKLKKSVKNLKFEEDDNENENSQEEDFEIQEEEESIE